MDITALAPGVAPPRFSAPRSCILVKATTAVRLIVHDAAELPIPAAEPSIMGMPDVLQPTYWTAEMVRALPDDGHRYEVVHGELLVTPAPRLWHQVVTFRLARRIAEYLDREPVGEVILSPADLSWDRETLVQPDLFVANALEARSLDWTRLQHLLLVVEVLSPATARHDRFTKRRRYQEAGVPVYWIVDPDGRQVEVWGPTDHTPLIGRQQIDWHPAGAAVPFVLSLEELLKPL